MILTNVLAPPKKSVKMDLGSFLADESIGGSWADEDVDMSSIGVAVNSGSGATSNLASRREEFQQSFSSGFEDSRPKREEFPVPDAPPYRARVGNLPYDVDESSLARFFEDRLQAAGSVSEVKVPMDTMNGRPKGFAFITFNERQLLEESLNLTLSEFKGRKIFVNVAAPQKQDVFDMDWRAARGSSIRGGSSFNEGGRSRRQEAELDWSSRGSGLPPRERGDRGERPERKPRREEPDLDWGTARSTTATLPPRERSNRTERIGGGERPERRPRKEEPDLDWGVARSTTATLPPRERSNRTERPIERKPKKEEPQLDWGAARSTTATIQPKERKFERAERPDKADKSDKFDWKRGQALEPRKPKTAASPKNAKQEKDNKKEKAQGPQKSLYDVLAVEGESDEETEEVKPEEEVKESQESAELEKATEKLTIDDSKDEGDWKVVGK